MKTAEAIYYGKIWHSIWFLKKIFKFLKRESDHIPKQAKMIIEQLHLAACYYIQISTKKAVLIHWSQLDTRNMHAACNNMHIKCSYTSTYYSCSADGRNKY